MEAPKAFTVPIIKNMPYTHILKAFPGFTSTADEARKVLQYVCFKKGLLCATNGHILIAADVKEWPMSENQFVENVPYKLTISKETALFDPLSAEAIDNLLPFPDGAVAMLKRAPANESFEFVTSIGDYLGIAKFTKHDKLGSLAFDLAEQNARVNLHYLSKLPLNQDFTVTGRKAESPEKGCVSPIHFYNDAVQCIIMPLRK